MSVEKIESAVQENINEVLSQADELLKKASESSAEEAQELQEKAHEKLAQAREELMAFYEQTSAQGKELCKHVNTCVHEKPWCAVGVAAAVGLLLGLLLAKK